MTIKYTKEQLNKFDKLSYSMNLIKMIADKIEFTNSEFKKAGLDIRQALQF